MTIRELILDDDYLVRVENGDRWLIGDKDIFVVYDTKYKVIVNKRIKENKIIYEGADEDKAVDALLKGR